MVEQPPKRSHLDELKEHVRELREFEDPDWDGTREDLELLWELKEALSRTVNASEQEEDAISEPVIDSENDELPLTDAELFFSELETPDESAVDQKKEKVEDAERRQ